MNDSQQTIAIDNVKIRSADIHVLSSDEMHDWKLASKQKNWQQQLLMDKKFRIREAKFVQQMRTQKRRFHCFKDCSTPAVVRVSYSSMMNPVIAYVYSASEATLKQYNNKIASTGRPPCRIPHRPIPLRLLAYIAGVQLLIVLMFNHAFSHFWTEIGLYRPIKL